MSNNGNPPFLTDSQYNLLVTTMINSINEKDKCLFTAATAGTGFCAVRLFNLSIIKNFYEFVFLFGSMLFFGITACLVAWIFHLNANHCKRIMQTAIFNENSTINKLDKITLWLFLISVLLFIVSIIFYGSSSK